MTSFALEIARFCIDEQLPVEEAAVRRRFQGREGFEEALAELAAAQMLVRRGSTFIVTEEAEFFFEGWTPTPRFALPPYDVASLPPPPSADFLAWPEVREVIDAFEMQPFTPQVYPGVRVVDVMPDLLAPDDDRWRSWADALSYVRGAYRFALSTYLGIGWKEMEDRLTKASDAMLIPHMRPGQGFYGAPLDEVSSNLVIILCNRALGGGKDTLAEALFEAYCHGYWPCGFTERYPARAPFVAMPLVRST